MELAGIILSVIALILTIATYFIHDHKIKKQERLLNEYQLEKNKIEKEETKKAIIEANVIRLSNNNPKIRVYNKGKTIARNVKVILPKEDRFTVWKNPFPLDIKPQNSYDIHISTYIGSPNKILIEFEWSDDYSELNKDQQYVQLY